MFSKNRDRLLTSEMLRKVMAAILAHREVAPLLSDDHFSVDGTLIKAWASMKSFKPKAEDAPPDNEGPGDPPAEGDAPAVSPDTPTAETDPEIAPMSRSNHRSRNAEVDFRGEKRSSATHASKTDPEARLYKKAPGKGAMLCFMGHALMENRHGLIVQGDLTQADGHAERKAVLDMLHRHSPGSTRKLTLGADKAYDAAGLRGRSAPGLRDTACRPESPAFGNRWTHLSTQGLCPVDQASQADLGTFRLGQDRRRHGPDPLSRR